MILYLLITIAVLALSWYAGQMMDAGCVHGHLTETGCGVDCRDAAEAGGGRCAGRAGNVFAGIRRRLVGCGGVRGRRTAWLCLLAIYVILLVPAVLRQETGNDYLRYVEFFHLAAVDAYVPTEEGFNLLVKAIYFLCGYENYILVFAVFAAVTIALFLEAIREETWEDHPVSVQGLQHDGSSADAQGVQRGGSIAGAQGVRHGGCLAGAQWLHHSGSRFALTMYLFMMGGYYFQSYNTMRYYLALAAALLAAGYYRRRRYVGFLLIVLLASTIHRSVLVVLVLYPAAMHIWRRWQVLLVTVFGVSLVTLQGFWMKVVIRLYPSYENSEILAQAGTISWRNILRCALVLALVVLVHRLRDGGLDLRSEEPRIRALRFYVNATALALWLYVFGYFIPEVSRIGYYLVILQIFLIPALLDMIPQGQAAWRRRLTVVVMLYAAADFAVFLYSAYGSTIKLLPYKSWLFRDLNETPSRSID